MIRGPHDKRATSPSWGLALCVAASLGLAWPQPAQAQFFFPFLRPAKPQPEPLIVPPPSERASPRIRAPKPKKPKPVPAKPQAVVEPAIPKLTDNTAPYEPALLRLSEIMGALTYLRPLCGQNDGNAWRAKMSNLIEAEGMTDARRNRLAGAYNRGFRGYETSYRSCTDNARVVISRFVAEGGRIAHDISNRFGGS